ncbi:MAG: DNA polymerase III subunit delta [Gammaproteobacteria bacterium]|nr:DNA polymerase III subunit delta [Gammaproteobacteria bacterium]
MRLRADQLFSNLNRSGLAPIYLISGDEPLQVMECADEVRRFARERNFEERLVLDVGNGFDWNSLIEASANLSLFSSRRLLELRLGDKKPGRDGGDVLVRYAEQPPPDNVLIITANKLDKKTQETKWYRILDDAGITIEIWPIDARRLPDWIQQRTQKHGKQINGLAARLIAERVEGNLLAASQEIEKLCLLAKKNEIDVDEILSSVTDSTRFDVFQLIGSALAGDARQTVRMLSGLKSEGVDPMAIYGALMWEFRRLCSLSYSAKSGVSLDELFKKENIKGAERQHAVKTTLHQHTSDDLHALLRTAVYIDRKIKSSDRAIVWDLFQIFLLSLAGNSLIKPEFIYT